MRDTYKEIVRLLTTKGSQLGMNASAINYNEQNDPGPPAEGYITGGVRETIEIPDAYMSQAGASNASSFLTWLCSQ